MNVRASRGVRGEAAVLVCRTVRGAGAYRDGDAFRDGDAVRDAAVSLDAGGCEGVSGASAAAAAAAAALICAALPMRAMEASVSGWASIAAASLACRPARRACAGESCNNASL